MNKLDRIPLWLRKQRLVPGSYSPGTLTPTGHDVEVFCAAMAGVEGKDLKARFEMPMQDIAASIRVVRDAIKRGQVPPVVSVECAWVVPLIGGEKQAIVKREVLSSLAPQQSEAIADITDKPYEPIDREAHDAVPKFLAEAKARFAVAAAPLALRRLAEAVVKGSPSAVTQAREFLFGKASGGPSVAIQQNFGGGAGASDGARNTPAFHYENVILKYEADHPDAAGEVTQFNESLLEGQEAETE